MRLLEQAVDLVVQWPAQRRKEREEVLAHLRSLSAGCEEALAVWKEYLTATAPPGDRWSIISWIGPDRAQQLFAISQRTKAAIQQLCRAVDAKLYQFAHYEENPIETAYRQLEPGQTGPEAARKAIERMEGRMAELQELIRRVESGTGKAG